jgi:hypothetical protein
MYVSYLADARFQYGKQMYSFKESWCILKGVPNLIFIFASLQNIARVLYKWRQQYTIQIESDSVKNAKISDGLSLAQEWWNTQLWISDSHSRNIEIFWKKTLYWTVQL